jgi:hypothetical protein
MPSSTSGLVVDQFAWHPKNQLDDFPSPGPEVHINPKAIRLQDDDIAYKRARRSADEEDENAEFKRDSVTMRIVQNNATINSTYCSTEECTHGTGGNYTYRVPVSKYFPHAPATIEFIISGLGVYLCNETEPDHDCEGLDEFVMGHIGVVQGREANNWDLPVGYYKKTIFKFRVSAPKQSHDVVCSKTVSELGKTFSEYNLIFHRICNA